MVTVGYDSGQNKCLVDPSWELVDPTPDIHTLFRVFNKTFFWNRLDAVEVFWDKQMSTAAGYCGYNRVDGSCWIALSEPLLKFRPRKDLVETLLHEMIHAYLFVTQRQDTSSHGREFHQHMSRINNKTGASIKVYHDFYEEIDHYFKHVWVCNGVCRSRPPFYGVVKKSEDVPPGPGDYWWRAHQGFCGGTFVKRNQEMTTKSLGSEPLEQCPVCVVFVRNVNNHLQECLSKMMNSISFDFGECPVCYKDSTKSKSLTKIFKPNDLITYFKDCLNNIFQMEFTQKQLSCPVCLKMFGERNIESHVDECLKKHETIFNDTF